MTKKNQELFYWVIYIFILPPLVSGVALVVIYIINKLRRK